MGCCKSSFPQLLINHNQLPPEEFILIGAEHRSLAKSFKRMVGEIKEGWDIDVVKGRVRAIEEHYFKYRTKEEHYILRYFKSSKGYSYSSLVLAHALVGKLNQKQKEMVLSTWFTGDWISIESISLFVSSVVNLSCKIIPKIISQQQLMDTYQLEHYLIGLSAMRIKIASQLVTNLSDTENKQDLVTKILSVFPVLLSSTGLRNLAWHEFCQNKHQIPFVVCDTQSDCQYDTPKSAYYTSKFVPPSRGVPIPSSVESDVSSLVSSQDLTSEQRRYTTMHQTQVFFEKRERSFSFSLDTDKTTEDDPVIC